LFGAAKVISAVPINQTFLKKNLNKRLLKRQSYHLRRTITFVFDRSLKNSRYTTVEQAETAK
jgi:hypothetical protein